MLAALWALKKFGRYTFYAPRVTMHFPHHTELTITQNKDLPNRLQARLVELTSFGCRFVAGQGSWGTIVPAAMEDPYPQAPHWEHKDIQLEAPLSAPKLEAVDIKTELKAHFDGGCRSKMGSGGYAVWG